MQADHAAENTATQAAVKVMVRGVCKRFGATLAADHIDLDIYTGEFLTLLGASGCGKTTLMRMIAGFEHPDAGRTLPRARATWAWCFSNIRSFPT